ncbi:RagB/SusD family nutrient uptake outer membrane protein [Porphyromonas pogonae]|uniref:RagB/SusD family nutrient uptake outer membrane protein n=1 Tax=Porphyromonas pogonae TaxID=867595 RepID=UPI002E771DFD|nr:RagB/SusD family nutrient uptake outer membrane protein [Porphyromonas pogonae]
MTKIINYCITGGVAILTLFITSSCDKFLDIKPKGITIPKYIQEYEQLLNNPDLTKASDCYPSYMTDDAFLPEKGEGNVPALNSLEKNVTNLYTFKSETFGPSEEDPIWNLSYNRLYNYNVVIENIMNSKDGTEKEKLSIKAEALMGRAFEYLTLVNAYAKHYNPQTADKDPGVPLILDTDVTKGNLTRASVKDVYIQIEKDMKEALKYLPETPKGNVFRASMPVGDGIFSRMYLYMGNYTEALKYANKSLEKNSFLLDIKKYDVVNPTAAIGRLDIPEDRDNKENIFIRLAPYIFGLSGYICASEDLINIYDKDNDKRFLLYFSNKPFNVPAKYYVWLPYLSLNTSIATPEIYLIAAECEARIGSKERALELINKLRDNRILNNKPLTANTNEEALKLVLDERRRELVMNGCFRLIDLKRLNNDPKFAKTIVHKVGSKEYKLEPNSPKYIFPIPIKVLNFNKNMKPNER